MVIQGKRETTPGMGANPTKGTIISTDLERAATANANVTDNMTEPKCLSPRTSNQNQSKVLRDCPNGCPNHVALTTPLSNSQHPPSLLTPWPGSNFMSERQSIGDFGGRELRKRKNSGKNRRRRRRRRGGGSGRRCVSNDWKLLIAILFGRQRLTSPTDLHDSHLSVCLSVCLPLS